jgi:hypothetical protein
MAEINCHIPVKLRLGPEQDEAQLGELSERLARILASRIGFARRTIAAAHGHAAARAHAPTFDFKGEELDASTRAGIERAVRRAVADALSGERNAPSAPRILLASAELRTSRGGERKFWATLASELLVSRLTPGFEQADGAELSARRAKALQAIFSLLEHRQARNLIRRALTDSTESPSPVRMQTLVALEGERARGEVVRDLILYGAGRRGDRLAEESFARWLGEGQGREAVAYLEGRLSGADAGLRLKAALVVVDLLEMGQTAEATRLRTGLRNLREMAFRNGLLEEGTLGLVSLRQLVASRLAVLCDLIKPIIEEVERGVHGDTESAADQETLNRFLARLEEMRRRVLSYDLETLKELSGALALANEAAVHVQDRLKLLHDGARGIQQALGTETSEPDEIKALLEIRRRYLIVFTEALSDSRLARNLRDIDLDFLQFDHYLARYKWVAARRLYYETKNALLRIRDAYPNPLILSVPEFHQFANALEETEQIVESRFNPLAEYAGGRSLVAVDAIGLEQATEVGQIVTLFALRTAMFGQYVAALHLHNELVRNQIGTESFRSEHAATLQAFRKKLIAYYDRNDFAGFARNSFEAQQLLEHEQMEITHRARLDVVVQLAITAVAALVTAGLGAALTAGAIARLASLSRILTMLRSAGALGAITVAAETGVFTATQLAGEKLVFGKSYTLGETVERFVTDLAFAGIFNLVGKSVARLTRGSGELTRMVVPHVAGVTAATTVPGLAAAVQSGGWPPDVEMLLLEGLASYVVVGAVSAGVRKATAPGINQRVRAEGEKVNAELARLYERYRNAVETRTLTRQEFEAIRRERLGINNRMRALVEVLKAGKYIGDDQAEGMHAYLDRDDSFVRGVKFQGPPQLEGAINALPSPRGVVGLEPLGETNIYRYEPGRPPAGLSVLLSVYENKGLTVTRYGGGSVRVSDGRKTIFVVEPGPRVRGLLPAPESARRPPRLLESDTRPLDKDQLVKARSAFRDINPNAPRIMLAEFPEAVAVRALNLLYRNRHQLTKTWDVYALRGLGAMLDPARGIPPAAVEKLFADYLGQRELIDLFTKFGDISEMPGVNQLIGGTMTTRDTLLMIRAYHEIRANNFRLPDVMTPEALLGLRRWAMDTREPLIKKFRDTRDVNDRRLALLEAAGGKAPPPPGARIAEVLRRQLADLRPGINLFNGTPEEVVTAIEALARPRGGRFADADVRATFVGMIEKYRRRVDSFRRGGNVERNVLGEREEIEIITQVLEAGSEVWSLGMSLEVKINPSFYKLPNGGSVRNAKDELAVQLDVGARTVDGRLQLIEVTTGGLGLPGPFQSLDPGSGIANKDIDFSTLDDDNHEHRKWKQFIKMRALAMFSKDLGEATGFTDVRLPELVIRASYFTAPAREALIQLGFRPEPTGPAPTPSAPTPPAPSSAPPTP